METWTFFIIALGVLLFGFVSEPLQRSVLTPPMVFVGFGYLLGDVLQMGPFTHKVEVIQILAELTLVLVLFTDASTIRLKRLAQMHDLPVRMLVVGLPLTVVTGMVAVRWLFPELGWVEAGLLAAILAPTDAALGQAVVSNLKIPVRVRQTLNVESGLNDGLTLPIVLVLMVIAGAKGGDEAVSFAHWLRFFLTQLLFGPLVGISLSYGAAKLLEWSYAKSWITNSFLRLSALALALIAFSGAELVGGNGLIAAFTAGLTFGNIAHKVRHTLYEFSEAEGQLLTLLTFLVFGAELLPSGLAHIDIWVALYALASLTVVRAGPIALSLIGKRLRWETILFLGWFGPRGVASILFGMMILEETELAATQTIQTLFVTTVSFSIVLHGLTAAPLAELYAGYMARMAHHKTASEKTWVDEMALGIGCRRTDKKRTGAHKAEGRREHERS